MYVLTNFINEDDRGLELDGQGEDSRCQFLGLAVPFISQSGRLQVDEPETSLFGCGFGDQSFSTAWGSVEQHSWKREDYLMTLLSPLPLVTAWQPFLLRTMKIIRVLTFGRLKQL